ncbi:MAG: MOSC domain-containing protein [Candidatus Edwardsbacteria bacterium]|jgi:MOSC domain-containing protein YiiM|nr:MOSC domain-containing protein [Candidatus Edwardsbacteria bacterium]
MMGTVIAVCVSRNKGEKKRDVGTAVLRAGHGIEGDAHAGDWHRQVSLLADESVDTMRGRGVELGPGDFAENLTVRGIDLKALTIGQRLQVGGSVLLEITQIGKECHDGCAIKKQVGDCVMPREGVFARVVAGGAVAAGDAISLADDT